MTMPEATAAQKIDIIPLKQLHYAQARPSLRATLKQEITDFCVDENLGFAFTGAGEHLCLRLKKTNLSTLAVAERIATLTGASMADIGYAGIKDRRAECTQWFSLPLTELAEGRIGAIEDEQLTILETQRNGRKIRIGSHRGNRFRIRLRHCVGAQSEFDRALAAIKEIGVPNYFGAQRFGRQMTNITQLLELIAAAGAQTRPKGQRYTRGMLYSAGRAYLFNQLLSARLRSGNWNQYVAGDVLNLGGTGRYFLLKGDEDWDQTLQRRLDSFDIHISGPLAGITAPKDKYVSSGEAADIEDAVLKQFPTLVNGLCHFGLRAGRRALRFLPGELEWCWLETGELELRFSLGRGCYATSLLRELCDTD